MIYVYVYQSTACLLFKSKQVNQPYRHKHTVTDTNTDTHTLLSYTMQVRVSMRVAPPELNPSLKRPHRRTDTDTET